VLYHLVIGNAFKLTDFEKYKTLLLTQLFHIKVKESKVSRLKMALPEKLLDNLEMNKSLSP
jgi:hypothetical protein